MEQLQERIARDARHLGKGILKVDAFINHQIDAALMREVGDEMARRFKNSAPTKVLTVESSGIAPALATAMSLGVPLVFARKRQPVTMAADPYKATAPSHTKGGEVDLIVSREFLTAADRVLIVDDFLATAYTVQALVKIVKESGATLVGIGAVIEKAYSKGREILGDVGVPVESLAIIESCEGETITMAGAVQPD